MVKYQWLLLAAYLAVQGIEYWLKGLNLNHLKKYGEEVPPEFKGHLDEPLLKKTVAYTIETSRFASIESLFGSITVVVFIFGGPLKWYSGVVSSFGVPFIVKGLIFFFLLSVVQTLLSVPFSLYHTFRIENKYGFNTMTWRLWAVDFLKSLGLSALIMGLLTAGGLWIVRSSPEYWWVFVWAFSFVVSVFLMYLSPYVIEPLFNKFTPIEGDDLDRDIRTIMERAGIHVSRVFSMDASRRSRHTNAYFSGIGRVKRIVLFDTLIRMMEKSEILAVLAHEAGHWKKKHVLKTIALFEVLSLAGIYAAFRIIGTGWLARLFSLEGDSFFAQLILLAFVSGIFAFPLTPLFSGLSRRHEDEADRFASELTGSPEGLATALIKLSKDNLSNLHPHPLYARFYYSHPPVVERIRRMREGFVTRA